MFGSPAKLEQARLKMVFGSLSRYFYRKVLEQKKKKRSSPPCICSRSALDSSSQAQPESALSTRPEVGDLARLV
jgi:hypothetical protein